MKYSGANIRVSLSNLFKSNKTIKLIILVLSFVLILIIWEFYSLNKNELEMFDCELYVKDETLTEVDSLNIAIYHSYPNEFVLINEDDTVKNLRSINKTKREATYSALISYTSHTTPKALEMMSTGTLPAESQEWKTAEDLIQRYNVNQNGQISSYRTYNSSELSFGTNNRRWSNLPRLNIVRQGDLETGNAKRIKKGPSIGVGSKTDFSSKLSSEGVSYHLTTDRIYELKFQDSGDECYAPVLSDEDIDQIFTGQLKTHQQAVYNLYFRKFVFPQGTRCSLTIQFPSATSFEITSIPPDETTAVSITYNSPESIRKISQQGLYVNARPLSNNNYIESRNFIISTLIGAIISIIVELIISLAIEHSKRKESNNQKDLANY